MFPELSRYSHTIILFSLEKLVRWHGKLKYINQSDLRNANNKSGIASI